MAMGDIFGLVSQGISAVIGGVGTGVGKAIGGGIGGGIKAFSDELKGKDKDGEGDCPDCQGEGSGFDALNSACEFGKNGQVPALNPSNVSINL